ncbi:glycosyltransferase family 4 protein [Pseudomonas sp. Z1-6]|uniref:glycosyltransferase family 4 protein n=1 Tax=Pseudomonas sp. Z1-6 TaxID=2817407 RepID=UPI003DA87572
MSNVFIVTEYVSATQNSTGFFWSKIVKKIGDELGRVAVIYPRTGGASGNFEHPAVVEMPFTSLRFNKNILLLRMLSQLLQVLGFCWYIIKHVRKGDVLLSGTNPAFLLMAIPVLKLFLGFRWGVLVHDVFPENLVPAQIISSSNRLYPAISRLFSKIYDTAELLIVIGRDMQELMNSKIKNPSKIVFVPNWADELEVYPLARHQAPFIEELGWQDKLVFQFFGNIGRLQGVGNILDAIALVENERAAFLFMGDGAFVAKVNEFIVNHPEKNVAYAGAIPLKDKNLGLAAGDVALITLEEGMLGLGVPSKAYFSLAADKPLLAVMDENAEIARMIQETGEGWQCKPGDPRALAELILSICNTDLGALRGRSIAAFRESYSEYVVLNKFYIAVSKLIRLKK